MRWLRRLSHVTFNDSVVLVAASDSTRLADLFVGRTVFIWQGVTVVPVPQFSATSRANWPGPFARNLLLVTHVGNPEGLDLTELLQSGTELECVAAAVLEEVEATAKDDEPSRVRRD